MNPQSRAMLHSKGVTVRANLEALLERLEIIPDDQSLTVPVSCIRCRDTGLIEITGGSYVSDRGLKLTATPERPAYRRCNCTHRSREPVKPRRQFSASD